MFEAIMTILLALNVLVNWWTYKHLRGRDGHQEQNGPRGDL